jgi:hypothetical protein
MSKIIHGSSDQKIPWNHNKFVAANPEYRKRIHTYVRKYTEVNSFALSVKSNTHISINDHP